MELSRLEPRPHSPPGRGVIALLLCLAAGPLSAHPFHASVAEAEFNPSTGTLEVALQVHPPDFQRALRRRRPGLRLTDERLEAEAARYLGEVFRVLTPGGERAPLRWVGLEPGIRATWCYFEFPLPDGLEGIRIDNRIFFEFESRQVNTINLRRDGRWEAFSITPTAAEARRSYAELSRLEKLERAREVITVTWTSVRRDLGELARGRWLDSREPSPAPRTPTGSPPPTPDQALRAIARLLAEKMLESDPAPTPGESRAIAFLQVTTLALLDGRIDEARQKLLQAWIELREMPSTSLEPVAFELTARVALEAGQLRPATVFAQGLGSSRIPADLEDSLRRGLSPSELRKTRGTTRSMSPAARMDYARSYLVNLRLPAR